MMECDKLRELIERAIEEYNRYRAPEAIARLEEFDCKRAVVSFTGPYCLTCGVIDWIEDFKYTLEDLGVRARLESVIEPEDPSEPWRIGIFVIER